MARPVSVRALPNFRIWLRYSDGVEGEVTGTATVERDKWRIELTVVRRDSIPFETEGQKHQAEARLRATYVMTRAVQRVSP